MATETKHGGKRKGAGRKPANPEGRTVTVAASVPEGLVEQLGKLAEKKGWNRSQSITEAIRRLLGKSRREGESNPIREDSYGRI
jgi:hypothetical protein